MKINTPTITCLAAAMIMLGTVPIGAQEHEQLQEQPLSPSEAGSGCLLLRSDGGRFVAAPTLETDVHITVRGPIARVRVRQGFHNPTPEWLEGVYVFPLPPGAAVDRLRMIVGERIIEGQIKEREEARAIYQQARNEGRKASLVEQERPNIFTTSVANIGPDEQISVEIEYQETVAFDASGFHLRFPMVVGPRFIPGNALRGPGYGSGWAADTDAVPDASRITPPVAVGAEAPENPVRLTVDLDPGVPLQRLTSEHHAVEISRVGEHRRTVTLDQTLVPADRDFVLDWTPAVGSDPMTTLFTEEFDGEAFMLVMVVPPDAEALESVRLPREVVFVIDSSGSMHGESIAQAKAALLWALDELGPDDFFNVIRFSNTSSSLFVTSRQAFPAAVDRAREYVGGLQADGGTMMLPALEASLGEDQELTPVRQVVFITDGCVGNEDQLFAAIRSIIGRTRLFTVGIGSAPNSHFMERAARFGRGTFTYIGRVDEIGEKMRELFAKIDAPVITDIEVLWPDAQADWYPRRVQDLYGGEPLVVAARVATVGGEVLVTGYRGDTPWELRIPAVSAEGRGGVHQLWARRKIASLMDGLGAGVPRDQLRTEVVQVALRHHLASKYTSLVAVDVTPVRPQGRELDQRNVPTRLPHGWTASKVFGQLPKGATFASLWMMLGVALLATAVALRVALGVFR